VASGAPRAARLAGLARFLEIQNLGLNLPFVLAFLLTASGGWPSARDALLVVLAFVAARNAGHSFNRWADRELDARNPRTAERLLARSPSGGRAALGFAGANAVLLVACAALLSPLALALVPVALLLVLGYSYTKRFTSLTTVALGLVEAIAPAGVYAGVRDALPPAAWIAAGALLAWGTAFELVHSLGDRASDSALGLRSIPVRLGEARSLRLLPALHAVAIALLAWFGWVAALRPGYFVGLAALAAGAAVADGWVFARPTATRRPFRMHFVLAGIFLASVLLGLFGPMG